MTKTASAKTNGHPVDAIRAVATRSAPRAVPKPPVKAAARAPVKVAAKTIKAPAKTAVKAAVKAAARTAPVRKPVKAAAKKTVAAPVTAKPGAARPAAKTAAKAAPKTAVKKTPKTVSAHVETEREKLGKPKLVRDSFTMPEQEYAALAQVKKACLKAGFEIKKSELLRIGVALISKIGMPELKRILADLPQLKTGRPKNS